MNRNQRRMFKTALGMSYLVLSAAAVAADPPASVAGMIQACYDCHGPAGVSAEPDVPTIAGIPLYVHADYLAAFQDGARTCSEEQEAMCTATKDLSEEQMEAFGEFFASLPFKAAPQEFDPEKAAIGAQIHADNCARCHTDGGSNPDDEASILAGQWMPYLRASLKSFIAGEREQPKKMKAKTETLSEADCDALVHYYASLQ